MKLVGEHVVNVFCSQSIVSSIIWLHILMVMVGSDFCRTSGSKVRTLQLNVSSIVMYDTGELKYLFSSTISLSSECSSHLQKNQIGYGLQSPKEIISVEKSRNPKRVNF